MATQSGVNRGDNTSSLRVILNCLLSNVHMKPITYTPLEGGPQPILSDAKVDEAGSRR